jgi:hypothetical protein
MSPSDGYSDEMSIYLSDDQIEALFHGNTSEDAGLASLEGAFSSLRSLGSAAVPEDVARFHVTVVAAEAARSPQPERKKTEPVPNMRPRRRPVISSLLSTALGKALAASVALAAATGGVAVVADSAVPGDALYGLDRAAENIGVGDGGVTERVEEARALLEVDLPAAVETAGEAAATNGDEASAEALTAAAEQVRSAEGETSALTREAVAQLLEAIAGGATGQDVADAARQIAGAGDLPEEAQVPDEPGSEAGESPVNPDPTTPEQPVEPTLPVETVPPVTTPDATIPDTPDPTIPEQGGTSQTPPSTRP